MMMSTTKLLTSIAIIFCFAFYSDSVLAQTTVVKSPLKSPSTYRVIAPESVKHHANHSATQPAIVQQRSPAPYSYGWFGATNTGQWSRQFGYSRSYIQWNRK
ncbi:MAG: hypothetical protein MUC83_09030 [Pirellula sp.]|nr:hypothetical protein [Pirellula sp.]